MKYKVVAYQNMSSDPDFEKEFELLSKAQTVAHNLACSMGLEHTYKLTKHNPTLVSGYECRNGIVEIHTV